MIDVYIQGVNRRQRMLLPECVEDDVGQDCIARAVDAFVEDMPRGGAHGCLPKDLRQAPHPGLSEQGPFHPGPGARGVPQSAPPSAAVGFPSARRP